MWNIKLQFLFVGEAPYAPFSIAKNVTNDKLKILLQAFKETLKQVSELK